MHNQCRKNEKKCANTFTLKQFISKSHCDYVDDDDDNDDDDDDNHDDADHVRFTVEGCPMHN